VAWTYSFNPGYSAKDQVRFLIGDTDSSEQLLQDGEIQWLLDQYQGHTMTAAIRACETIMSKFARLADEKVGQVSIQFSQKAKSYQVMLNQLRNRLAIEDMTPFAGGISRSDKITEDQNSDRVRPDFTKHMMDDFQVGPGVAGQGILGNQNNTDDDI
jgi:hypothetical protein